MEYVTLIELIQNVGFPIAMVLFFAFWQKTSAKNHREDMQQIISKYDETTKANTEILHSLKTLIKERKI